MFRKLSVIRYAMLFGALLAFGILPNTQAEAGVKRAICKTVKGPVYISRSLTKSRYLAYSKCARYRKGSWQFLRRKVRCVKRYRKGKRIYRCRCIARLCKPRTAAKAKKTMKEPAKKKEMKKAEKPPVSTQKSDREEMAKKEPEEKAASKKEEPKADDKKTDEKKAE